MQLVERDNPLISPVSHPKPLVVGLLGCGVVGSAIAQKLLKAPERSERLIGCPIRVKSVAVLHPEKPRDVPLHRSAYTEAGSIVHDPEIEVVIEAIGGIDPPLGLIREALRAGKDVITANKDLIATHGPELRELADRRDVHLLYEAAVAGAIPILRAVTESLRGTRIEALSGILNGTCNFILTAMESYGLTHPQALAKATELGYAEPDSTSDTEGWDTAYKLAILIREAFSVDVDPAEISRESIGRISLEDLRGAIATGRRIRLVAHAAWDGDTLEASVNLAAVPSSQALANLAGCENGVVLETQDAGELLFTGPGAGGDATASSVLGDLARAASLPPIPRQPSLGARIPRRPKNQRLLIRVTHRSEDFEASARGALFGHGVATDELKATSDEELVIVTEPCSSETADFVSECLRSRGAVTVSIFPTT